MPISEEHPSSSNAERPEDRLLESFFAAAKGWREYDTPEGADKENRILLGAVRAIIDHALPHLKPEDVPGVRNALLEELAEEAETTLANGQSAARYLRSKKEPRDD